MFSAKVYPPHFY